MASTFGLISRVTDVSERPNIVGAGGSAGSERSESFKSTNKL